MSRITKLVEKWREDAALLGEVGGIRGEVAKSVTSLRADQLEKALTFSVLREHDRESIAEMCRAVRHIFEETRSGRGSHDPFSMMSHVGRELTKLEEQLNRSDA